MQVGQVRPVGHEAAGLHKQAKGVYPGSRFLPDRSTICVRRSMVTACGSAISPWGLPLVRFAKACSRCRPVPPPLGARGVTFNAWAVAGSVPNRCGGDGVWETARTADAGDLGHGLPEQLATHFPANSSA